MLKIYHYPKCTGCKNALKFVDKKGIKHTTIDISEKPPTKAELKKMLTFMDGNIKKLFNTSGKIYREMKLSEKLDSLSESDALDLLASEGMLIKRPFALSSSDGTVGFKEAEWKKLT